ncbi:MAG TPA: beta-ketoacyl synthase N-terminal-like domain-containing protein, partial [Candidatus Hydrogenedentes bacterium]|nr:beta-ketoacyl synthase N-terminal-like domain-containing protein [Candidatus Hydrogenedentota bacterium]
MPFSKDTPVKQRAVIVAGVRTPFVRAFGSLMTLNTIALGTAATRVLLEKLGSAGTRIDGVLWGGAILPSATPNVGREIVLDSGIAPTVEATTLSRACTSGFIAATEAAAMIERGEADIMIAGGSDSTSNAEVKMPPSFVHKTAPVVMNAKSGVKDYFRLLFNLSVRKDLLPQRPSIRERTTKELMGEAAERMARFWGITREEQD